jgi:hypothetical protein
VQGDLQRLEELAPQINKRHAEYEDRRRRQQEALKALEGKHAKSLSQELDGLSIQERASRRTSYERPALDARNLDNHSLAARLAQREVRRRDTQRRSVRQAGVSDEEEQERRTGGVWGTWDDEYARQGRPGDDLSSQIQEVARLQRDGRRTSHSQVGIHSRLKERTSLTRTAPAFAVVYTSVQLPLRTAHLRSRSMVTIKRTSSLPPSSPAERANIQILGHALTPTTSSTEAVHTNTIESLRPPLSAPSTREIRV